MWYVITFNSNDLCDFVGPFVTKEEAEDFCEKYGPDPRDEERAVIIQPDSMSNWLQIRRVL